MSGLLIMHAHRYASGGGRELHFTEEKEIDLAELTSAQLPKIPMGVALRWVFLNILGLFHTSFLPSEGIA